MFFRTDAHALGLGCRLGFAPHLGFGLGLDALALFLHALGLGLLVLADPHVREGREVLGALGAHGSEVREEKAPVVAVAAQDVAV